MAERPAADALLELWKQQIEAGTKAWTEAMGRAQTAAPEQFWRPVMDQGMAAWAALMAQGPVSPDLMAQWKQFLDQWIAAWGEALERAMGTEAFAQALGKHLERWLTAQAPAMKAGAEVADAALSAVGMPSRAQVAAVARQLDALEDRIERLEDILNALAARGVSAGGAAAPQPGQAGGRAAPGRSASRKRRR